MYVCILILFSILFMCMGVLPICLSSLHVDAVPKEGVDSPICVNSCVCMASQTKHQEELRGWLSSEEHLLLLL